jgi:hypothetical protein
VRWTLTELDGLVKPIIALGSGAMLLAANTMMREMNEPELTNLTNRALDEERGRRLLPNVES